MATRTSRAFVLGLTLAACTTFAGERSDGGAADAALAEGGVGTDDGGELDGGAETSTADGGCGGPAPFKDDFERTDLLGGWQLKAQSGGTLIDIDPGNALGKGNSLRANLQAGGGGEAYLQRNVDATACVLEVSFLVKVNGLLGPGDEATFLTLQLASSAIVVLMTTDGQVAVRERRSDDTGLPETTVGSLPNGGVRRITMKLDTRAQQIHVTVGADGVATTPSTVAAKTNHMSPKHVRIGAMGVTASFASTYFIDNFDLR